jgi:restriction system protein
VAVPDFQSCMRPILALLSDGKAWSQAQLRNAVAEVLQVSEEDQLELLPSGKQTTFSNRVGWALTHLSKARLVERPAPAQYRITDRGRSVLAEHPDRVDMSVLYAFPEYKEFRALKHHKELPEKALPQGDEVSPSEAVGRLVEASDSAVAVDLLDRVVAQPAVFLEKLAVFLLKAMGYGGRESLIDHTGKPGDAGLDGVVRQDALGLDLVGIQAKRYEKDAVVNRPELQAFVGALQGAQTNRGVFITTGRFSSGAKTFADSVGMRLVLIDGPELAQLMVRYNVGVLVRETFDLKQLDEEFFEQ